MGATDIPSIGPNRYYIELDYNTYFGSFSSHYYVYSHSETDALKIAAKYISHPASKLQVISGIADFGFNAIERDLAFYKLYYQQDLEELKNRNPISFNSDNIVTVYSVKSDCTLLVGNAPLSLTTGMYVGFYHNDVFQLWSKISENVPDLPDYWVDLVDYRKSILDNIDKLREKVPSLSELAEDRHIPKLR